MQPGRGRERRVGRRAESRNAGRRGRVSAGGRRFPRRPGPSQAPVRPQVNLERGQVLRALSGDSFQVARGFGKLPVLQLDQAEVETGVRVAGLERQSLSEVTLGLRLVAELKGVDPEIIQNGNRVGLKLQYLEKRIAGFGVVALLRVRYTEPEEGFRVPARLAESGRD